MSKFKIGFCVLIVLFASFMLINPETAKNGAATGLLICSNIIIPTLFPFAFCTLFITNTTRIESAVNSSRITHFLFGLDLDEFIIFLFSLIGGYPTGAKLIENRFYGSDCHQHKPALMLCYCVNAGPAFIVAAVGMGILNSKKLGWLLLSSHIISSVIIALILRPLTAKHTAKRRTSKSDMSLSENFLNSAANAASATFSVCIFVVLFGGFNAFIEYLSVYLPFLKYISPLLEVTSAVANSNNIYHIAFLLGFGGVCVWCQILGLLKDFKLNLYYFITSRVIHGILSIIITYLLLKIFKITIPTFSNLVSFNSSLGKGSISLTFSLIVMGILFIVSTFNNNNILKIKNTGKTKKDML